MNACALLFCVLFTWINGISSATVDPYDLDVIPLNLPPLAHVDSSYNKHVPRKIWMAVKDIKDELPGHIKAFLKRNNQWEANICDNDCKDQFINSTFSGTSVQWAYNLVRTPHYFASKADIWRYAVLYTYGGMYLDDDSDIKLPLDEVIQLEDRLILSEEGASSMGDCYVPTFHLSDTHTYFTYAHNVTKAKHYDATGNQFFHGNTLINWAMFAAPRHPLYHRALQNIVEIIKSMYLHHSVVHLTRWDVKFKPIFCVTGFVLTYSMRELELENDMPAEWLPRISTNNFREYGGNVKAISTQKDPSHYRQELKHSAPPFLKDFSPLNWERYLNYLEGKAVMGDGGKEILLIQNGTKRHFPGYDTFLNMHFTDKHIKHVGDEVLNKIPLGAMISPTEKIESVYSPQHVHKVLGQQRSAHQGGHQKKQSQHDRKIKAAFSGPEHKQALSEGQALVVNFLKDVQTTVNSKEMGCWGDDYGGTRDDYLKGQWEDVLKGTPVMVYPLCTGMYQLGNTLGYYLNDIACADISGSHFVAVHKTFALTQPELLVTHTADLPPIAAPGATTTTAVQALPVAEDPRYTFFNNLPDVIAHSHPLEPTKVKETMKAQCHCLQFCWENNQAPWLQRVPLIGRTLRPAIDAYVKASRGETTGTLLNSATDKSTLPMGTFLPLVPNVTIQYRCGDNIGFGKSKYGLLPFSVYKGHRISKDVARYIYIIADSPNRSAAHVYSGRCETILQRLFAYLVKEHPKAVVVLKRGGDLFLDYARIAYSNIAVCSASTFCLWPALSNQHGQVHFPLTPLVAKADTNLTAPNLAPNFHWISEVGMIKQFKHYRPWDRVIDDLESM